MGNFQPQFNCHLPWEATWVFSASLLPASPTQRWPAAPWVWAGAWGQGPGARLWAECRKACRPPCAHLLTWACLSGLGLAAGSPPAGEATRALELAYRVIGQHAGDTIWAKQWPEGQPRGVICPRWAASMWHLVLIFQCKVIRDTSMKDPSGPQHPQAPDGLGSGVDFLHLNGWRWIKMAMFSLCREL